MLDHWNAQIFFFTSMHLRKKCESEICNSENQLFANKLVLLLAMVLDI